MEQALRLAPWPASSRLVSLNNGAGALELCLAAVTDRAIRAGVLGASPALEERRVLEARGAGSVPQALMHLTSGDQVSALRPAPSLLCLGTQRARRIIVCNPK